MKQTLLALSLLILAPLSLQAQSEGPDEFCVTIYTMDQAFYAKALQSEKVADLWEIYSMELQRKGRQATMLVEGTDQNNQQTTLNIALEQSCGTGAVVEK